jgi:hypothetical protein
MKRPLPKLRPLSPADIGLGSAIAAGMVVIWFVGRFSSLHGSDSLIHSLNSLYKWTPFVWEYDHVGSLLSLIARFITRPYWNVLAVSGMSALLFLTGLALWGCLLFPLTFTESNIWVAILIPLTLTQHAIFQIASQGVTSGVALFFSGLYVCTLRIALSSQQEPGLTSIFGLFALAFVTTYLSKIAFIPMTTVTGGLLWLHRPLSRRRMATIGACLFLALFCYHFLEQASPYRKDYTLRLASLSIAFPRALGSWGWSYMTGILWLLAPALLAVSQPPRRIALYLAWGAGIAVQTSLILCSHWMAMNSYDGHYLYDLSFLTLLGTLGLIAGFKRRWLPTGIARGATLALLALAVCMNAYAWDAFHPVNPLVQMEATLGANTAAMVAASCDLVVGGYWTAWPAMLAVNDYYYQNHVLDPRSGHPRRVYAIAYLAGSTEDLWRPILEQPNVKICSISGDEKNYQLYLGNYAPEFAMQTIPIAQIGHVILHQVRFRRVQSLILDFDSPPPGKGWSYQETTPGGETFTWTTPPITTLSLPLATHQTADLEFRVVMTMAPDILENLVLHVNGQPIQLSSTSDPDGGTVFTGTIPQSVLAADERTTLFSFEISRSLIPQFTNPGSDDPRPLGLAFDWLRIEGQP